MSCSTVPASYFTPLNKECAAHSLVKALDTFLREVQEMRDVIMVPNRLRGVPLPKTVKPVISGNRSPSSSGMNNEGKNGMAVLAVGSRALIPYSANGLVLMNGLRRADEKSENLKSQEFVWPEDLYRRYKVVQALRRELTAGRCTVLEEDENDDEQTRILTAHFRQYLNGFYEVLDQLTDMAKGLSIWYQEEVHATGKH